MKILNFEEKAVIRVCNSVVLLSILLLYLHYIPLSRLLLNTQLVGGDTTAHYYYAWYLHHQCLPKGEILCWSNDLLMGYPLLQYYFPFPFLLPALLGFVIPFKIAFKLSVLGYMLLIPYSLYFFCKRLRLPFPGPALAALAATGLMFTEHNFHSGFYVLDNLSGQFSSTFAIALFFIFLGMLFSSIEHHRNIRGAISAGFVLGISCLSHGMLVPLLSFLISGIYFVFHPLRKTAFTKIFISLFLGYALFSFWALPLFFDTDFSYSPKISKTVDWKFYLNFFEPFHQGVFFLSFLGLPFIFKRREQSGFLLLQGMLLTGGFLVLSLLSNYFGKLPVLDRYLPVYLLYLGALGAYGLSHLLEKTDVEWRAIVLLLLGLLVHGRIFTSTKILPQWAEQNFSGLEAHELYQPFIEVMNQVASYPNEGRLSTMMLYDSKLIKAVAGPFLSDILPIYINKPVLSTGTQGFYSLSFTAVNLFFYEGIASGDPKRLSLLSELLNVQYILKTSRTEAAILNDVFELLFEIGWEPGEKIQLYSRRIKRWNYVEVPDFAPLHYVGKENGVDLLHKTFKSIERASIPLVFSKAFKGKNVSELSEISSERIDNANCVLEELENNQESFTFKTSCPGKPHIVRFSYHPGWKSLSGEQIYHVTPNFLLLYPQGEVVTLKYGPTLAGRVGQILALCSLLIITLSIFSAALTKRTQTKAHRR